MKTKNIKIGMSIALASLLSLSMTGCGSDDDSSSSTAKTSSAVDVTVERGKVYDANVTDSATPAQVATQKVGQNVYTFANAPTYPVVVNGGWIDVNDDGVMDANDTVLDIEMRSYGVTVTPITTTIATESNATKRAVMLQDLADKLNVVGVGSDTNVTVADLLKVPSDAPHDVMVVANATFKDMKESNTSDFNLGHVMSQFGTLYSDDATAVTMEQDVVSNLESQSLVEKVSNQDIFEFIQDQPDAVVPELAIALLLNNITGLGYLDAYDFRIDYTLAVANPQGISRTLRWSVNGNKLIVDLSDGDREEYTFDSATPTDNSSVSMVGFYGDTDTTPSVSTITVSAPVVVTDPTVGGGDDTTSDGGSLPDLNGYSSIIIYKNIAQATADSLLNIYANNSGFSSSNTSASCTDFGFTSTDLVSEANAGGISIKTYSIINMTTYTSRSCSETDYSGASYGGGSANILAYYGN